MTKSAAIAEQVPWEVKLHAFRKTQDGVVVSFVVHPAEVPRALALDDLGTRYMMALVRIEEDGAADTPEEPASASEEKKAQHPFKSLPRSQQAGIACQDVRFQRWMAEWANHPNDIGGEVTAARLRGRLDITSRANLDRPSNWIGPDPLWEQWDALYAKFEQDTGRVAAVR